jgi:hypothetical protein
MSAERAALLEAWLDGSIGPDELKELTALLKSDPGFRADAVQALRVGGLLQAAVGPDASCERLADVVQIAIPSGRALDAAVMESIERRGLKPNKRAHRWARLAVAMAAAWAFAIGLWIILHQPPAVRLAAAEAQARIERKGASFPATPGLALHEGDVVLGWAIIRYEDGTTLDLGAGSRLLLESKEIDAKRVRLQKGRLLANVAPQPPGRAMIVASPQVETQVLGTVFRLSVDQETRIVVHHGAVAFGSTPVSTGQAATARPGKAPVVESAARDLLRRLGREHFQLGIMSGLGETYIKDTQAQGCRWDFRYQHLTPEWPRWNKDAGFPSLYLEECRRLGTTAVFTYYALMKKREPENADVMKRYFADLKTFMQKAGEREEPCILHVEPGVWASIEHVKVAVRSSGLPELEGLDDSAASFGKAFGLLRDRYAPNVLLAWHASSGERPEAIFLSGSWDLLFTDVADRDAGFNDANGKPGTWWKDKDFEDFRAWCGELHRQTGLPILIWRIPLGNTLMAACNNTPWHYEDNRAEYWLENYPSNRRIAEWSQAGVVGLLFGGGAVGCTVHRDNARDGVTNPAPVPGNKGETSTFPDDDGGYLRLRAGKYYQNPYRISGN